MEQAIRVLKRKLQIGLVDIVEVIDWGGAELSLCDELDEDLGELASMSMHCSKDEITILSFLEKGAPELSIHKELFRDFLSKSTFDEASARMVAGCMESLELIGPSLFGNKAGYFKCAFEDADLGNYSDAKTIQAELIDFLTQRLLFMDDG